MSIDLFVQVLKAGWTVYRNYCLFFVLLVLLMTSPFLLKTTEEEVFSNTEESLGFLEFLEFLGDKIQLQNFRGCVPSTVGKPDWVKEHCVFRGCDSVRALLAEKCSVLWIPVQVEKPRMLLSTVLSGNQLELRSLLVFSFKGLLVSQSDPQYQ